MPRQTNVGRSPGRTRILDCALAAFCENGYQATKVKEIAERAGVTVPGIYHHFTSKYQILMILIRRVMDDLIEETSNAMDKAGTDPVDRFAAAVETHVRFHAERQQESFVGNTELRSLERDDLTEIVRLRDAQQETFERLVAEGVAAGRFHVDSVKDASRAVVTMCTSVATWYRTGGALTSDQVAAQYRVYALGALHADSPGGAR
ncbi:TetR/AcrR family transcriptional regulator [Amycolatopsis alkalitolerans]|uniref:TetR/AcrR family transcriptional regulator n=1 Tax=Amycolatopsis alkalitolerans TaxID=2547244 RepID=A0A5C4LZ82_9PSEU|nr:TetR/AcrR family transcriptional regulator [Amycolatopsis alkalitolerans]TNC25157.1 TetR/AcrR family transcriptional regulator [Amycolatopsis alkalitolerans]